MRLGMPLEGLVALGEYSGTYEATYKGFRAPFPHACKFRAGKAAEFQHCTGTVVHLPAMQ